MRQPLVAAFMVGVVLVAGAAAPPTARAAFPGAAGRIAFVEDGRVMSVKPDGSDIKQLTTGAQSPYGDDAPAWSPGGTLIAFVRETSSLKGEIWVMQADGTHQHRLTTNPADDIQPQWSPDGSRLVFASDRLGDFDIFTMDLSGGSIHALTSASNDETDPAWSPDRKKIAYVKATLMDVPPEDSTCNGDINFMNADGTDRHTVQDCWAWVSPVASVCDFALTDPDWSSDGKNLAINEDCWGTPVLWEISSNDTLFGWSVWGKHGVAYDPSDVGQYPQTVYIADRSSGGTDLEIGYPAGSATTVIDSETRDGVRSSPDWQPIPAFPLVDARFSPFNADIQWVFKEAITKGCSAERYCPDDTVTRAQMASFLVRALHLPAATKDWFTDDNGLAAEGDINRVAEAGITSGCSLNHYCPADPVLRGAMASFLARAFSLPAADHDYFTDDTGTTHEANINKVAAAGITSGCTPTTYCPNSPVTRGQMAAFLRRALS